MKELLMRAKKEMESILAEIEPLRKKEAKLQEKYHALAEELLAVRQQIVELEEPRLRLAKLVIASHFNTAPSPESEAIYEQALKDFESLQ